MFFLAFHSSLHHRHERTLSICHCLDWRVLHGIEDVVLKLVVWSNIDVSTFVTRGIYVIWGGEHFTKLDISN